LGEKERLWRQLLESEKRVKQGSLGVEEELKGNEMAWSRRVFVKRKKRSKHLELTKIGVKEQSLGAKKKGAE
jgi:hypothetical protein